MKKPNNSIQLTKISKITIVYLLLFGLFFNCTNKPKKTIPKIEEQIIEVENITEDYSMPSISSKPIEFSKIDSIEAYCLCFQYNIDFNKVGERYCFFSTNIQSKNIVSPERKIKTIINSKKLNQILPNFKDVISKDTVLYGDDSRFVLLLYQKNFVDTLSYFDESSFMYNSLYRLNYHPNSVKQIMDIVTDGDPIDCE